MQNFPGGLFQKGIKNIMVLYAFFIYYIFLNFPVNVQKVIHFQESNCFRLHERSMIRL